MALERCRICLHSEMLTNIFFETLDAKMISTKVMSLAKVQIYPNDGLPSMICLKCIKKLDRCIDFINLCEESDAKLRSLLLDNETEDYFNLDHDNYSLNSLSTLSPKHSVEDLTVEPNLNYTGDKNYSDEEVVIESDCNSSSEHKKPIDKKSQKEQCFTCGKVMSSRFRLKTHLRTHTGERPFSCPHCSKAFSLAQNLKVHIRVHTGEKPLVCSECGEKFAQSAGLAAHRRKHTGQTPYLCTMCPRSFRTVGHLQYHVRRHTGEKNFECDVCERAFITRSDLKQHLLTHSRDKLHVCCICGLRLSRASHLKRHIKHAHKTDTHVTSKKKTCDKQTEGKNCVEAD